MKSDEFDEIVINDFTLESKGEDDGVFWFESKSLSSDFECDDGLKRLAKDSMGKHLVWRHAHPLQDEHHEAHIFGSVINSRVEGGHIISRYSCYDHTEDHEAHIKIIKDRMEIGDPLGISMHYRKYFDNKFGKITHYDVFEHSTTPIPKCDDCRNITFGVKKMEDEKEQESKDSEDEKKEVKMKEIKELEDKLNKKTNVLEDMKSKIEKLELDLKEKDSALEEKKEKEMTLEDKVNDLRKEVDYFRKKPTLDKILELKPMVSGDRYFNWLKEQDMDYISETLEKLESEVAKPKVESTEESAEKVREKTKEREDEVNEEDVRKKFIAQLNPQDKEKFMEYFKSKV